MKHTLTVTIDTPETVLTRLRHLVSQFDAFERRAAIDEAVDFDQLKTALDAQDAAERYWVRVTKYAAGAAAVLGMDDHLPLITAARDANRGPR